MKCSKCGNELENNAIFCDKCGNNINSVSNQKGKKINGGILKYIIIYFIVLITGIFIGFSYSIFKENLSNDLLSPIFNNSTNKETPNLDVSRIKVFSEDSSDLSKKILFEKAFYKYNKDNRYSKMSVLLKNNNDTNVEVTGYLNFYDSNKKRINSHIDHVFSVKPNSEFVLEIDVGPQEKFENFDFTYVTSNVKSYYNDVYIDPTYLQVFKNSSKINAVLSNYTGVELTASAACLYYKNGNIVYASNSNVFDLKANNSDEFKFYNSSIPNNIEYDDYKIILFSAYTKNSTY